MWEALVALGTGGVGSRRAVPSKHSTSRAGISFGFAPTVPQQLLGAFLVIQVAASRALSFHEMLS